MKNTMYTRNYFRITTWHNMNLLACKPVPLQLTFCITLNIVCHVFFPTIIIATILQFTSTRLQTAAKIVTNVPKN